MKKRGTADGRPGQSTMQHPRRGRKAGAQRAPRRPSEVRGPAPRRGPGLQAGSPAGPQTAPQPRPADRGGRPKNTEAAKARAKARKAKAPKVVRPPLRQRIEERLRERVLARLADVDLRPKALLARVPFVVLVIGALGVGLGLTLWLSTDAAQRSYQLGGARQLNTALAQQKEALERDVLQAESAPALADAARNLGMIPSRDTAHLVLDPAGNWVVVGQPKPAAGAPPPPLNTKLPDPTPPPPPSPTVAPRPGAGPEVPNRIGTSAAADAEVAVRLPNPADRHAAAIPNPGSAPLPGPDSLTGGLTLAPVDTAPMGSAPLGTAPMGSAPLGTAPMSSAPPDTAPMDVAPLVPPVPVAAEAAPTVPGGVG